MESGGRFDGDGTARLRGTATAQALAAGADRGADPTWPVAPSAVRNEDVPLVTGGDRYIADLVLPNELRCVFLRSPHAHARLRAVDARPALDVPGVVAVLTGADVVAAGLGGIPWEVHPPVAPGETQHPLGSPAVAVPQPLMAIDRVLYVGEIVAMVLAETEAAALDGAEQITVDYEPLPVVADLASALAPGADPLWPQAPGNRCFTIRRGDPAGVAAAFDGAAARVRVDCHNNRVAGAPIEVRGYIGHVRADDGCLVLHACAGKPHPIRKTLAEDVFRVPESRIQVKVPRIGGGFGIKNVLYPEECLVLFGAQRSGRPVKWLGTRLESFQSDIGCRDQRTTGEMGFDAQGRIIAFRATFLSNLGGYLAPRGVVPVRNAGNVMSSVYRIPVMAFEGVGVHTNTTPTCSFRGSGQPEMMYLIERLIDRGARALGLDPVEIRRRNLIPADAYPYRTPFGVTYDTGDPVAAMDATVAAADRDGFGERRAGSVGRSRLRGIGVANCMEVTGFGYDERAALTLRPDGRIEVLIGTQSSGQGHDTVYAQIVAGRFGLAVTDVLVVQGDTDRIATGNGTGASRSITVGGSATALAARTLADACMRLAGDALEAALADLEIRDGRVRVAGTDRSIDLRDLHAFAVRTGRTGDLSVTEAFFPPDGTFPYGCHVAEVEIDPETGTTRIERYTTVHDVGFALNPTLIEGQIHGGVVHGIGQALLEQVVYDAASGQLVTGSFMDYAMPRADDLPALSSGTIEIPSKNNLLGAKGVGESGSLGAPPAIMNAILDALAPLGVADLEMPATPGRIWQAIQDAKSGSRNHNEPTQGGA